MTTANGYNALLTPPSSDNSLPAIRRDHASAYVSLDTFKLPHGTVRHYGQQYADMYFQRLVQLKEIIKRRTDEEWRDLTIKGEKAPYVERVLDVKEGKLCWIIGTVYLKMPLKPDVMEDIAKEHWISAPPPRNKYFEAGAIETHLEDESGRLRISGSCLDDKLLVTGTVIAAVGSQNSDGVFDVLGINTAGLPSQPKRWALSDSTQSATVGDKRRRGSRVALVSGLGISGDPGDDVRLGLLVGSLTGGLGGPEDQAKMASVSRLIIAGEMLANDCPIPSRDELAVAKKTGAKRYGYDSSSYNPAPTEHLDEFLTSILPTIFVTMLPGATDPANVQMPQQPLHPGLFPKARLYTKPLHHGKTDDGEAVHMLDAVTNPWEGEVDGLRFLGNSGQPVDDALKYLEGDVNPLDVMECMMNWRCQAPTAPDTLWSYPFDEGDPFQITETPHVFFVGNQPSFGTRIIQGPDGQTVRLIALPSFRETGCMVLLDSDTLGVEKHASDVAMMSNSEFNGLDPVYGEVADAVPQSCLGTEAEPLATFEVLVKRHNHAAPTARSG